MDKLTLEDIVYELNDITKFLLQEPAEINAKNIRFMYKLLDELNVEWAELEVKKKDRIDVI